MPVTAGERATGRDLRFLRPIHVRLAGDIVTQSNDVLTDVPGMTLPLAAGIHYLFDGYIAYNSATAADIKLALSAAVDTTANGFNYGFLGIDSAASGTSGGYKAIRLTSPNTSADALFLSFGGAGTSTGMFCTPHGHLYSPQVPTVLQLQFCQATSDASATTIKAGSWLRMIQVAP